MTGFDASGRVVSAAVGASKKATVIELDAQQRAKSVVAPFSIRRRSPFLDQQMICSYAAEQEHQVCPEQETHAAGVESEQLLAEVQMLAG